MQGIGEPHMLMAGGGSPHTHAMRPSDGEALSRADAVFWVGPQLETFLQGALDNLSADARVVALIEAPELLVHIYDGPGTHGEHGHDHDHDHGDESHDHDHEHDTDGHGHGDHGHGSPDHAHDHRGPDPHVWLDPINAAAIVQAVVDALSELDAANADTYARNGAAMTERLRTLDAEIAERLKPYRDVPFYTFHDAFRYFAEHYGLNASGTIAVGPERQPGARHVAEIRERIGQGPRACVFAEPQFHPALIDVVVEETDTGTGTIDPLGAEIESGPDLYESLMRANAEALETCFADLS